MPWRPTRSLLAVAASALLLIGAAPAPPFARALLIGVGDYPALPASLHLSAPPKDVQRLRTALVGAGLQASAIQVMSEREGIRPTRAAILAELKRLAETARPGEQLLVYFSGHGAQAPARHPAQEPDGLEELYLASDAAGWDGGQRAVPGAIADFEMEQALQAIRDRGAEVWFIADACHAAGLTRSALPPGVRAKAVSAADLHIPLSGSALRSRSDEVAPLARGSFTAFYAAAPGTLALERPLPAGSAEAQPASVFTYALVRALGQGRFLSLRDLAMATTAASAETGSNAPAPVFEGALDSQMLGLVPVERRFRVHRKAGSLTVDAGAVEGFDPGAAVTLTDADGQWLARTHVLSAGLGSAELADPGGLPERPLSARADGVAVATAGERGRRLLQALAPITGDGQGLNVEARLLRRGCAPNPPARMGFPPEAQAFDLMAPPPLRHCDVLYLRIENDTPVAQDISPLYVDAQGGVVGLSLSPDDDVRLETLQHRYLALRIVTRDTSGAALPAGVERLVLVTATAHDRRLDLRSLAGPALVRGPEATPSLDRTGVGALVFPLRIQD